MRHRLIVLTAAIVFVLFGAFALRHSGGGAAVTFSAEALKEGSTGKDVVELQGRLKHLGYFGDEIDGHFGPSTRNAVTWFQWKFGLKSDGIVAGKTKVMLWKATKDWRPTAEDVPQADRKGGTAAAGGARARNASLPATNRLNLTANELKLMANAVYGEARGEPYKGQVAVAAVILNRVQDPNFPKSVSSVIFQPLAFTAVADGQIWLTPNETAMRAVRDAVNGWDPTNGCVYYFNPRTATSKWIWSRPQVMTIGQHIFCM